MTTVEGALIVTVGQHNFGRPWAPHRKRIYALCSAAGALIAGLPIPLVGLGILPMHPTDLVIAAAICVPIIAPMLTAWWDAPGENRTTLEKANEFMIVWFPITAASQIFWELSWLVGDALGKMHLTENDHWGWMWWFYGVADTRYLHSDPGLYGVEAVSVLGGIIMIIQWGRLLTARADDAKRINALWWSFFAMSVMLAMIAVYYAEEIRLGCADIEQGAWGFGLKFVFMNVPWLIAPAVSLPFCAKQLAYLYRRTGPATAGAPSSSATDVGDRMVTTA